ncbi:hypothetical protein SAMN05444172_3627 [Burkholderia sp. GAS332]|nr:hypothetical protein SAMN05444172_3627 [Burkholderia sp. GAS332]
MSELHASWLWRRVPAGLWRLGGLGRWVADWRSNGFDRVWCWTWVRSRVGFGRIRRRRLDWLGTVSVFWEGKRGSGGVFRHVGDPRFCVPLNRSKGYAGVGGRCGRRFLAYGGFLPTAVSCLRRFLAYGVCACFWFSFSLSLFSLLWAFLDLFAFAALVSVCLRRWAFLDLVAFAALVSLCAYGVGLSLNS